MSMSERMAIESEPISHGQIARQSSSYRQGLVLGLTMAEILILLVFCLLIALATFLKVEQQKRLDAEQQLETEKMQNAAYRTAAVATKENTAFYSRLADAARSNDPGKLDEFWRELVESRSAMADLKKGGLSEKDLRQRLAEGQKLVAQGLDADKAIRSANNLANVKSLYPNATDDNLINLIKGTLEKAAPDSANGGHRWPPIINLSDAEYRFKSGSAELSAVSQQSLRDKVPARILALIKEFDVDVIEVVGHTDEQPLGLKQSNLDRGLLSVLRNNGEISRLVPADNAGLGLARAVAVASILLKDPTIAPYKIVPLSGAQLIKNDETLAVEALAVDDPERRRIEIRLRKSSPRDVPIATEAPPFVPTPRVRPPRPSTRPSTRPSVIETQPLSPPLFIRPQ